MSHSKKKDQPAPESKDVALKAASPDAESNDGAEPSPITLNGRIYSARWERTRPEHAREEIEAIEADIKLKGRIEEPILVSRANNLLDGFLRAKIALKLGLADVPLRVYDHDLSLEQEKELVLDRVLLQRNLSLAGKKKLADQFFEQPTPMPIKKLALKLAVSRNTVKKWKEIWKKRGGKLTTRKRADEPIQDGNAQVAALRGAVEACETHVKKFVKLFSEPNSDPGVEFTHGRQLAGRLHRAASSITDAIEAAEQDDA